MNLVVKIQPDYEVLIDELNAELDEIHEDNNLPRWAFLSSEWNDLVMRRTQLRNEIRKCKEALREELLYC